ncbi:hypothetical protein BH10PLA1_BH10PLA1_17030 [soil metagenome]
MKLLEVNSTSTPGDDTIHHNMLPPTTFSFTLFTIAITMALTAAAIAADKTAPPPKAVSILCVGDSITEGSDHFVSYRYPLWEKLFAHGYVIQYVGSKTSNTRIGPINHEGYGGKTAEFLDEHIEQFYKANPADIVLLASGHNHDTAEEPIEGIVKANESIIRKVLAIRPDAIVLVAQVIHSGKLPKYSYIPEVNQAIAKMALRVDPSQKHVICVDLANGYDWNTDTIEDHVHPNAAGADKIAGRWFDALAKVLPAPPAWQEPKVVVYKKTKQRELSLSIFQPDGKKPVAPAPAIVYFFGGGWSQGTPIQFYRECNHFAARGMVAISVDYRIASVDKTAPADSLEDAKSAMRWVRSHAAELGVDPTRIAGAGASAGGQLAAAAAFSTGFNAPADDLAISPRPDALLLYYAVVDNGPAGYGIASVNDAYRDFSPMHAMRAPVPPTTFFLGTKDNLIPVATAEAYQKKVESLGGRCDLHLYEGRGHPIYLYREGESPLSREVLKTADDFLVSLKYLSP